MFDYISAHDAASERNPTVKRGLPVFASQYFGRGREGPLANHIYVWDQGIHHDHHLRPPSSSSSSLFIIVRSPSSSHISSESWGSLCRSHLLSLSLSLFSLSLLFPFLLYFLRQFQVLQPPPPFQEQKLDWNAPLGLVISSCSSRARLWKATNKVGLPELPGNANLRPGGEHSCGSFFLQS